MYRVAFLLILLTATSCGKAMRERDAYLCCYQQGAFQPASAKIEQMKTKKCDSVWLHLDQATIQLASSNGEAAAEIYKCAVEEIDLYNQTSVPEEVGKLILQDDVGAYVAADFEQILARLYFALSLELIGDRQNAAAMLRQAEFAQQEFAVSYEKVNYTKEYHPPENALGKYLLGLFAEAAGDPSNADILYWQTANLLNISRTESPLFQKEKGKATLLVVCHNGNAPFKISVTTSASIASTIALEAFMGKCRPLPASSCVGIQTPKLIYDPFSAAACITATIDGSRACFTTCCDVGKMAFCELEQKLPAIVAKGLARYLVRRAAVDAAYAKNQNVGSALDLAVCIANLMTQADTRTWGTLPLTIDCARFELTPGEQTITLSSETNEIATATLTLTPDSLTIIHLFYLHPGITTLVLPKGVCP